MVRQVQPWAGNTKKRLVKSPKVYLRDTGLLHRLLTISDYDMLQGHPVRGHSWEGFVLENIIGVLSDKWNHSYYRTTAQTEIDLILEGPQGQVWAIEVKRTFAPKLRSGFYRACDDIRATKKICYIFWYGKISHGWRCRSHWVSRFPEIRNGSHKHRELG